jgi:hypothetical protein
MDMNEVQQIADHYDFRPIRKGENETSYRHALATFLRREGHIIEAYEVASGKRWDQDDATATSILGAVSKTMQSREYPGDELGTDFAAGVIAAKPEQDDGLGSALNALGTEAFAAFIAGMFGK